MFVELVDFDADRTYSSDHAQFSSRGRHHDSNNRSETRCQFVILHRLKRDPESCRSGARYQDLIVEDKED